jgi:argininosuccinate lyase
MLVSLLSIGRSLFIGYNRDTQWTKYLIMDLVDECSPAPPIMAEVIASLRVNEKETAARCQKGFIEAPDLLERIVADRGIPFRRAKGAVEKAVKYSEKEGADRINPSALRRALNEEGIHLEVNERLLATAQDPKLIVSRRKAVGGTSPQENIAHLKGYLRICNRWLRTKRNQISRAQTSLALMEKRI